jgi:hypothetical protein
MWPLAMGAARLRPIPSNRQCSRSGKWSGSTISSPRTQGWPKLGRRMRRRGRTARTGGVGRGGSALATTRALLGQQVARDGSTGSREGTWVVARPWKAGRGAARRRRRGWRGGVAMTARGGENVGYL